MATGSATRRRGRRRRSRAGTYFDSLSVAQAAAGAQVADSCASVCASKERSNSSKRARAGCPSLNTRPRWRKLFIELAKVNATSSGARRKRSRPDLRPRLDSGGFRKGSRMVLPKLFSDRRGALRPVPCAENQRYPPLCLRSSSWLRQPALPARLCARSRGAGSRRCHDGLAELNKGEYERAVQLLRCAAGDKHGPMPWRNDIPARLP